jgi:hypothetical protein
MMTDLRFACVPVMLCLCGCASAATRVVDAPHMIVNESLNCEGRTARLSHHGGRWHDLQQRTSGILIVLVERMGDRAPIAGVQLTLATEGRTHDTIGALTDSSGVAHLIAPARDYRLMAAHLGFRSGDFPWTVRQGVMDSIVVSLDVHAICE